MADWNMNRLQPLNANSWSNYTFKDPGLGGFVPPIRQPNGQPTGGITPQGSRIADPQGYQQMRQQVQSGSNFMPEQQRLSDLLSNPASIQTDPSYQFNLEQGNQAINRSAAAKGMLGSGNVLAELARYGQGMASQEYRNQFNRLSDLLRQKQQFGLTSGYFDEPTRTTSAQEGGAFVTRRDENPTFW